MTSDPWKKAEELYHAALDREPSEREKRKPESRQSARAASAISAPWHAPLEQIHRSVEEADSKLLASQDRPPREVGLSLIGEGLRSWVLLARSLGIDPEQALREADDARIASARGRLGS